ncbi:MAG: MotA/TolQ/ExbB proton channel family protein [Elusimicrobia bacterium]|nr:MotA/TolQ/ExbB proton channel family protein [Elusimicrobiota bacterium]
MDWTTLIGLISGIAVVVYGLLETQSAHAFLNIHGLILVVGGTIAATFINTPFSLIGDALRSLRFLFLKPKGVAPSEAIRTIVSLAEKARRMGNLSIENDGQGVGDGFLQASIDVCLATSDEKLSREILSLRVRQAKSRHTEVANVFRTMSILFPMFGLVGTLIGIVTVLKNISNPKNVGPAMAVALSTAFFGILLANMVCVPVAGKLRLRAIEEALSQEIFIEGVLKIFFSPMIPSQIGLYLESYMAGRSKGSAAGAPAVEGAAKTA